MAGRLITLPLRASLRSAQISLRSAQLVTRAAGGVAGRALSIGEQAIGLVSPGRFDRAGNHGADRAGDNGASPVQQAASAETTTPPPRVDRAPPRVDRPPPRPPAPPVPRAEPIAPPTEPPVRLGERTVPPAEPRHVSEEPELVEASAEPGAEDGAGADITVVEPWNGYAKMSARDVIDRAGRATSAELAAIGLYEARHRARQTVLAAVDRQLKLANGSRPA